MKKFEIKQHLYTGIISKGSVSENTIGLLYFPDKESKKFVKSFTRSFADNNLKHVTINISSVEEFDNDDLAVALDELTSNEKYIEKETIKNIPKFLENFSVYYNGKKYDVSMTSRIGQLILEKTKFKEFSKISNEELLKLIDL